jgi:hypothetical protein
MIISVYKIQAGKHPVKEISRFYRNNYGKIGPADLGDFDLKLVPFVRNPPANWERLLRAIWVKLKEGVYPSRLVKPLIDLGWAVEPETASAFLRNWLRNVAIEVWEESEEELLAKRGRSRKNVKRKIPPLPKVTGSKTAIVQAPAPPEPPPSPPPPTDELWMEEYQRSHSADEIEALKSLMAECERLHDSPENS